MTEGTGSPVGVDAERVGDWFRDNIPGSEPPLSFNLISGGRSNLTFEAIDTAGSRYVLRRPPTGHVLPTAHDMSREYRVISGMGRAGVPVAKALGLCTDESVTGAPFYIMSFVDGVIARTERDVEEHLSLDTRKAAGMSIAATLAQIHSVDPDAVGLGDLGRREGYISRQLRRWYANYQAARDSRQGDLVADVDEVHDLLASSIPSQTTTSVVHGDYRLDNCVVSPDGSVAAVLDWELCTLGDPLADLGQLAVYWPEPGERSALGHAPTTAPGFPSRAELLECYREAAGRDVGPLDFYQAFAYWKLACILEGVYTRYLLGAMGDDGFDSSFYPETIRWLAAQAREAATAIKR